jgi:hypothetical protein
VAAQDTLAVYVTEIGCLLMQFLLPTLKACATTSQPSVNGASERDEILQPPVIMTTIVNYVCGSVLDIDKQALVLVVQLISLLLQQTPLGTS